MSEQRYSFPANYTTLAEIPVVCPSCERATQWEQLSRRQFGVAVVCIRCKVAHAFGPGGVQVYPHKPVVGESR